MPVTKKPAMMKRTSAKTAKMDMAALDQHILQFVEKAKEVGGDSADPAALPWKDYFSPSQMSALWNRLSSKITASGDTTLKGGWANLGQQGQRQGKTTQKRTVLWLKLAYPADWQSRTASYIQTISKSETSAVQEMPKTRGELYQIHGETEACDLITNGFFEEVMIRNVPHFVKVQFNKTTAVTKSQTESITMNKTIGQNELLELEASFESFKVQPLGVQLMISRIAIAENSNICVIRILFSRNHDCGFQQL